MDKLQKLKIRLNIDNQDEDMLLSALLTEAYLFIIGYTRRNEDQWLTVFDNIQLQMAMISYSRLGAEGVQSQKEGEILTSFYDTGEDLPKSVINTLNSYRLARVVT